MKELADRCGAGYQRATIGSVDPERRRVRTHDEEELPYDSLIVACGSRRLAEISKHGIEGAGLVVVTPEDAPLHLFGRAASERVGELLAERGIEVVTGAMPVDGRGLVRGMDYVYAAGDVTTFPVKQGGIATQQADREQPAVPIGPSRRRARRNLERRRGAALGRSGRREDRQPLPGALPGPGRPLGRLIRVAGNPSPRSGE